MKTINISVTLNCIKLTQTEKILIACIKSTLYDYYKEPPEEYEENRSYHIEVSEMDGLCKVKIIDTFKGVFQDVKKLIQPILFNITLQGGFNEETKITIFYLQRFEIQKETITINQTYAKLKLIV